MVPMKFSQPSLLGIAGRNLISPPEAFITAGVQTPPIRLVPPPVARQRLGSRVRPTKWERQLFSHATEQVASATRGSGTIPGRSAGRARRVPGSTRDMWRCPTRRGRSVRSARAALGGGIGECDEDEEHSEDDGDGDGDYDDCDDSDDDDCIALSPKEALTNRRVEEALAIVSRTRGKGGPGKWVEQEAPVEEFVIRGRRVLVKRDDQMRLAGSRISGNKARKMYSLNKTPPERFPELVVSHGGHQSNAMLSLAAIVASKPGAGFVYYTKPLGKWIRGQPSGNLARVLALGAQVVELEPEEYEQMFGGKDGPTRPSPRLIPEDALFIPQGGADSDAEEGIALLAQEISEYWRSTAGLAQTLQVIVPAGTGTTALFLARHLLPHGIGVTAIPCVGDSNYLLRQMKKVDKMSGNFQVFPVVMEGRSKQAFAKPRTELLEVWRELDDVGLLVDLVYGARAWEVIMERWQEGEHPAADRSNDGHDEELRSGSVNSESDFEPQLMYLHTGGLEGVSTQLARYKYVGLLRK